MREAGKSAPPCPRLLEEFRLAEETKTVFELLGWTIEPWVALRMARTEGDHLRREVARHRQTMGRRVRDLREVMAKTIVPLDPADFEWVLAMLLREGADHPSDEKVKARRDELAAYRRTLEKLASAEDPEPVADGILPPGVDNELLGDLRLAEQFLDALQTGPRKLEMWEAFTLAVDHRDAIRAASWRLRGFGPLDDLNSDVIRVLEKLIEVRTKFAPLSRRLRELVAGLPIGRYNRDLMELATAFILASPEGRQRVEQWLESPDHWRREAAIRVEGVIGRAQKYQHALRAVPVA